MPNGHELHLRYDPSRVTYRIEWGDPSIPGDKGKRDYINVVFLLKANPVLGDGTSYTYHANCFKALDCQITARAYKLSAKLSELRVHFGSGGKNVTVPGSDLTLVVPL